MMMHYIHNHRDWPRFTWDSGRLAASLAETRFRQGLLLGGMQALDAASQQEAEKAVLQADARYTRSLEKSGADAGKSNGEYAMLRDVLEGKNNLLTAARLEEWQRLILPGVKSAGMRGMDDAPKRIIYGPLGWEKVRFEAPEAHRLPEEMRAFLAWYNFGKLPAPEAEGGPEKAAGQAQNLQPALWEDAVIRSGVAHFWFITIHPYNDGSARMARALGDMMLHRADAGSKRFYSLAERIHRENPEYHNALRAAQNNDMDITPWLDWYLHCLGRAILQSRELLAPVLKKAVMRKQAETASLSHRQQLVLDAMINGGIKEVSSGSYARMAETSPDSALRDIQDLLEQGLLRKNPGGGRSTTYSLRTVLK